MVKINNIIATLNNERDKIQRFGVKRIGVFGSVARNESRPRSDVDVLVEFREDSKTFDNYMDLKLFLERKFKRKVDLVSKSALKPRLKSRILQSTVYAGL